LESKLQTFSNSKEYTNPPKIQLIEHYNEEIKQKRKKETDIRKNIAGKTFTGKNRK